MDTPLFRESLTNAIRFWERARLLYNGILLLVVIGCFIARYPESRAALSVDMILAMFLAAVVVNVAYCSGYPVDIFVQMSGYREHWGKYRWVLFAVGVVFAGILTRFWSLSAFSMHTN